MQSKTKQPHNLLLVLHLNRKFVSKLLYIMLVTANAMQIGANTRHCNTKGPFLASLHSIMNLIPETHRTTHQAIWNASSRNLYR